MSSARFYKFRAIDSELLKRGELSKDRSLEALLSSTAIFSGRKNFNDLFDSKIDIPRPTAEQVLELLRAPNIGGNAKTINKWISNGAFTFAGHSALGSLQGLLNEMFDSYPIYCLCSHYDCPLLWAHYASSHTGFCLEFEFPGDQPRRVDYRDHIPTVPLLDFIKYQFGMIGANFGVRLQDALHVKLNCWAYEGEYRWIANNAMGRIPIGGKIIKISYDPQWVRAVIFGCRTDRAVKEYIRANLPFNTEFKQAIEAKDRIEVVPFSEAAHL